MDVGKIIQVGLPATVSVLYLAVAIYYAIKKDYAWMLVWVSYAMANTGLILVGLRTS